MIKLLKIDSLISQMKSKRSSICLGLDPFIEKIPSHFIEEGEKYFGKTISAITYAILQFNKKVLDLSKDKVAVVKPQFSLYLKYGPEGVIVFYQTIEYAKKLGLLVIVDAKSNDIDTSMEGYASGFLGKIECFGQKIEGFNGDFLTVNPYLGSDTFKSLQNIFQEYGKGAFILAKTSNPSSSEFQDKIIEGKPLYWHVAKKVDENFSSHNTEYGFLPCGLVVGATMPVQLKELRDEFPKLFFLIPGYGAQGGTIDSLKNVVVKNVGFIVNSSRSILYSYRDKYNSYDFESAISKSIDEMNNEINTIAEY